MIYKFSIHVRSVVSLGPPLRSLPGSTVAPGVREAMRSGAFPRPLPPLVAKGTMVLPAKSADSRNVSMMRGSTYHQMGKPTKMVS